MSKGKFQFRYPQGFEQMVVTRGLDHPFDFHQKKHHIE